MIEKSPYILIIISLVLLLFILSPLELAFVVSDSMEPVLQPNDDIFILNTANDEVSDFETGEIVTFYSQDQDQLITHRVVDVQRDGLITKGDNSFQTDQERGDPPVKSSVIEGEGVMIDGSLFTISNLANLVIFVQDQGLRILIILSIILLLDVVRNSDRKIRNDRIFTYKPLKITFIASITLLIFWSGGIYLGSITESAPNVITDDERSNSIGRFISTDTVSQRTIEFEVKESFVPTEDRVDIEGNAKITNKTVLDNGNILINYTVGPYEEEDVFTPVFTIYPYPKTLPSDIITKMHNIHPIVASFGTLIPISIVPIILSILLTQNSRLRTSRSRALRKLRSKMRGPKW